MSRQKGFFEVWELIKTCPKTFDMLQRVQSTANLVTDVGINNALGLVLGASDAVDFPYMAFGNGTSFSVASADLHLQAELIGNTNRFPTTNDLGNPFSVADTVADTSVSPFRRRLNADILIPSGDPNAGATITEAGLVSALACPGSPTTASGVLYNHVKFGSSFVLDGTTDTTLRMLYRG